MAAVGDGVERVGRRVDAVLEQQGDAEAGAERAQRGEHGRDAHVRRRGAVDEHRARGRRAATAQSATRMIRRSSSLRRRCRRPCRRPTGMSCSAFTANTSPSTMPRGNREIDARRRDHERGADADDRQDGDVLGELAEVRRRVELPGGLDREHDDDREQRAEGDDYGAASRRRCRSVRGRLAPPSRRRLGLRLRGRAALLALVMPAPRSNTRRRSRRSAARRSASPRRKRATRAPRRMTSMRSATSSTCGRLWETKTTARPRSRMRVISSSTFAVWMHAERGGRLVHDDRVLGPHRGPRDGDRLALAAGERGRPARAGPAPCRRRAP